MNLFGWFRRSSDPRGGRADEPAPAESHAAPSGARPPDARSSDAAPQHLAPVLPNGGASPEEVRKLLFDAVAAGDEGRLESLCREHRDFILAESAGWLEVPEAFRTSPEAYTWYGNGLRAIARFCSEKLSHPEPLADLQPTPQSSTSRN